MKHKPFIPPGIVWTPFAPAQSVAFAHQGTLTTETLSTVYREIMQDHDIAKHNTTLSRDLISRAKQITVIDIILRRNKILKKFCS